MPPKAILSSQWNRPLPSPSRRSSPSQPSIHTPTQRCHVRVSHSNFRLEPDARNFANSDHAYITARLTKKILSAFFLCFFPLLSSLSRFYIFFLSLFFFFSFRVVPLDTVKSFWNNRCASRNLRRRKFRCRWPASSALKLFNFEFSFRHGFSFR